LKVAYILQNASIDLSAGLGTQLHIRGVLTGAKHSIGSIKLVTINGQIVNTVDAPNNIGLDIVLEKDPVELGITGTSPFQIIESGFRRLQTEMKLPYFSFWDGIRLYDACCQYIADYDILHAHFDLVPMAASLANRRMNIPLVVDCEADWFYEYKLQNIRLNPLQEHWARWWQKRIFDLASAIICVSSELRDHLIENWSLPADKMHILPNGVDVDRFSSPSTEKVHVWEENLGLVGVPVVMFVGGFYIWHALDELVESFVKVQNAVSSCRLVLVGDGPTYENVRAQVEKFNLEQSVVWVGRVSHSSVPDLLALADIVVSPATEFTLDKTIRPPKTSPLKIFEYMAAGKACVASATGQMKEVITHEETGLLVAPGDIKGFSESIVRMLSQIDERERLGQNAYLQVLENHSWENYGKKLESIYKNILSKSRG